MKFFHVYNDEYFEGLVKNNLINQDTGFKIQHCFAVPQKIQFNTFAAKGTKLHALIKDGKHPFYVDRIAGGVTYYEYAFDRDLIREYEDLLGDWFLGFQLHESASNRNNDWNNLKRYMQGETGPFDLETLRKNSIRPKAKTPEGMVLHGFAQGTPEEYAPLKRAETVTEYISEIETMFKKYLNKTDNHILPCDSYFLFSRMQDKLGMRTFMPEVGCQIAQMRIAVALARGTATAANKTWGTYYETWMESTDHKYSMPCFNKEPGNEWYLTQETHSDDFTSYGEVGGSSRHLQKRIYYHTLMSGADYMAEEWGLNCSYADMNTFELSPYGFAKKEFIDFTQDMRSVKATIPFAIVLPTTYECVEITDPFMPYSFAQHRDTYMYRNMSESEKLIVNHAEDVLKFIYGRNEDKIYGTEGHTLTNSRFGDLFDIIYADASDEVFAKYDALIDASHDGSFAEAKKGTSLKIFASNDFDKLAHEINEAASALLPCVADNLHWILSTDGEDRRFVTVFNNEGNNRNLTTGDDLISEAAADVTLSFKAACTPKCIKHGTEAVTLTKVDDTTYTLHLPPAGFAILEY